MTPIIGRRVGSPFFSVEQLGLLVERNVVRRANSENAGKNNQPTLR